MWAKTKKFFKDYIRDIRSIPAILLTIFVVTLVAMNILANKTIFQNDYIAIDGGIVVTWIVIVIMDLVVAVCGPKVAVKMSTFGLLISLLVSLIFFLVSLFPSTEQFKEINKLLGGTWFIIISSAIAFLCSSTLNAIINYFIGKSFKKNPEGKLAFSLRSHVSTLIAEIFDNFTFNALAFMVFAPIFWNGFCWTPVQCICCALLYGAIQLTIEVVLFPLIYKLYKSLLARHSNKKCEK